MTHPFPTGVRVRGHPMVLDRVLGPFPVIGFGGKLVDKWRYVFLDTEGNEYQWWTTSDLEGVKVGEVSSLSFTTGDLETSYTSIKRVQKCESKT